MTRSAREVPDVTRLRGALTAANALIAEAADECKRMLDRISELEGLVASQVNATLLLAASVCDNVARRTREEGDGGARIEESAALSCRDAILALLGEREEAAPRKGSQFDAATERLRYYAATEWLSQNQGLASVYSGQYVAIDQNGALIAHDPKLSDLYEHVRELRGDAQNVTFFALPARPSNPDGHR